MLGENLLMAPIFSEDVDTRDVYLAGPATWKYLWTGEEFEVDSNGTLLTDFAAPLGQPIVFTRDTEAFKISAIFTEEYGSGVKEASLRAAGGKPSLEILQ